MRVVFVLLLAACAGSESLRTEPDYSSIAIHPEGTMAATEAAKKLATFAAGCFWGVELTFQRTAGVLATEVGYTGGKETAKNPTYEQVCTGSTDHAEAVRIEFDAEKVTFAELLDVFFDNHDPTTLNAQGPDVGSQYRSAVFYHDEEQKEAAEAAIKKWSGSFSKPIVTQVLPATTWYAAEDYHQKYLEKKGHDACPLASRKKSSH
ncbi:msrA [Symbiodinium sp. KB8]|nr:msrA [Symbiodinium sp. KB8]